MTKSSGQSSCENVCKDIHESLGKLNHLVRVLAGRSVQFECGRIREKYMEMYGEDLFDLLQEKINDGHNERMDFSSKSYVALSMLMLNPHERDAVAAKDAIFKQRDSVNYKALIEIYAGRKSSHFFLIQQAYQCKFRRHLDQDIISLEPPHSYQKLLVALAASQKAHSAEVSQHIAKCDAQRLFQAGEGRSCGSSVDEAVVLEILSKRSIQQLKLTFSIYKHIYGHSFVKSFKNKCNSEFEDALKAVVKFISDPPKYYAKALQASIEGNTLDKGEVERIMVSRAEIDMTEIQRVYKNKYGLELRDAILHRIPAGEFRDLLVALTTKSVIDA